MINVDTLPPINGYSWVLEEFPEGDERDESVFLVHITTGEIVYELSPFYGSKAVTVLGPRDNDEMAPRFISFEFAAKYVKERIEK